MTEASWYQRKIHFLRWLARTDPFVSTVLIVASRVFNEAAERFTSSVRLRTSRRAETISLNVLISGASGEWVQGYCALLAAQQAQNLLP